MSYPIIIPMPIHSGSGNMSNYIYPEWVKILTITSLGVVMFGLILVLISLLLVVLDHWPSDKFTNISFAVTIVGAIFMIISVCCMALTGTPVTTQ